MRQPTCLPQGGVGSRYNVLQVVRQGPTLLPRRNRLCTSHRKLPTPGPSFPHTRKDSPSEHWQTTMKHPPGYVQPGHHSHPSNPYRVPSRNTVPAECPTKIGQTPALQPHYPEASLLTWSGKQRREEPVSVDVTEASTGPPPTIVPSVNPADGGKHDCRASVPSRPSDPMLATTSIISQLKPGKTTVISSSPHTVNGEESAETSRRPHGRSRDRNEDQKHTFFRTLTLPGS